MHTQLKRSSALTFTESKSTFVKLNQVQLFMLLRDLHISIFLNYYVEKQRQHKYTMSSHT